MNIQSSDNELSKQTVFIKLHLGLLGNSRKVSSLQVEVDADKSLIRVSKSLLDPPELQAVRTLDGDIRRTGGESFKQRTTNRSSDSLHSARRNC